MDIIAGGAVAILFIILFFISERIPVPKKISTALLSGFIVFIIFTKKVELIEQKIGVIVVTLLLIYAVNLKVGKEENEESQTPGKEE